jgi:hypothetical protein
VTDGIDGMVLEEPGVIELPPEVATKAYVVVLFASTGVSLSERSPAYSVKVIAETPFPVES